MFRLYGHDACLSLAGVHGIPDSLVAIKKLPLDAFSGYLPLFGEKT